MSTTIKKAQMPEYKILVLPELSEKIQKLADNALTFLKAHSKNSAALLHMKPPKIVLVDAERSITGWFLEDSISINLSAVETDLNKIHKRNVPEMAKGALGVDNVITHELLHFYRRHAIKDKASADSTYLQSAGIEEPMALFAASVFDCRYMRHDNPALKSAEIVRRLSEITSYYENGKTYTGVDAAYEYIQASGAKEPQDLQGLFRGEGKNDYTVCRNYTIYAGIAIVFFAIKRFNIITSMEDALDKPLHRIESEIASALSDEGSRNIITEAIRLRLSAAERSDESR